MLGLNRRLRIPVEIDAVHRDSRFMDAAGAVDSRTPADSSDAPHGHMAIGRMALP
jgi:hypothetical protein